MQIESHLLFMQISILGKNPGVLQAITIIFSKDNKKK
jgi:hypothetical protein